MLLRRDSSDQRLHALQAAAEERDIPCQQLDDRQLEARAAGHRHQGVVALCNAYAYTDWDLLRQQILDEIAEGASPVLMVAGAIEDPHNLGAIARTAVGLGVRALLLPQRGGCGLTASAEEASAGSLVHLPAARPRDLAGVLVDLAANGFRIVGLDAAGFDIAGVDLAGPVVLVAGGEHRGIPPHLRRNCTTLARLPMSDKLQSYNASVAAALALYEVFRRRT